LDQAEAAPVPPRDRDWVIDETGGKDDRKMCAAVEAYPDFVLGYGDVGRHVDEVAEDLARLGIVVAAHAAGHQAIEVSLPKTLSN
jgi:hypothetical protein